MLMMEIIIRNNNKRHDSRMYKNTNTPLISGFEAIQLVVKTRTISDSWQESPLDYAL